MALVGANRMVIRNLVTAVSLFMFWQLVSVLVSARRSTTSDEVSETNGAHPSPYTVINAIVEFLWGHSGYQHVWPEMEFGWQIIFGSLIGIFGAAFGSVGGVGGGGIFVPMLVLVIGFDTKSATAISKCMIMGAAISTVFFNWKLKHPTLDTAMTDYNMVLLIQPILVLGISIGVILSEIFAGWMLTVLLIILFTVTSIKAFFKGVETWKKETIIKEESEKLLESTATVSVEEEYKSLPGSPHDGTPKENRKPEGTILGFRFWKELGLLAFVWLAYLVIQIAKTYTTSCSTEYWLLNLLQIPVSLGVFLYQAVGLHQGWRSISSRGDQGARWPLHHLILASLCALLAGIIGGLLGIGSGFVMGPLFLELGILPQVASATATFGMAFSSSLSVVQYYLLNRFPVPYALYLTLVAAVAAFIGQDIISKLVKRFGRASLIIFVLSFTVFVSTITLGGVGILDIIGKIQRNEYMGFENLCKNDA
ncbi:hypothetical protein RIF29_27897 [Crotalaria pallida]|uniref:Sulfite exporter TauE/SafE family protein 3-like n=1 Tax=Crotalaria pallida TaxID=3830 RepID=A0AAN9EQW2_CROPI